MCRSIKTLRVEERIATDDEVRAAALQFVRKISGMRKASQANTPAFDQAIDEVVAASHKLLGTLGPKAAARA